MYRIIIKKNNKLFTFEIENLQSPQIEQIVEQQYQEITIEKIQNLTKKLKHKD